MQVEPMGGSITIPGLRQQTSICDVPCETEVIVKLSSRGMIRRGDYPCGCRRCREATAAVKTQRTSSLATIDVYDLPDGVEGDSAQYFH